MIDTHSHILPGLDDGAADISDTVELARAAVRAGVREVICTPHVRDRGDRALTHGAQALAAAERALAAADIPLRLHLGYEVSFSFAAELEMEELEGLTLGSDSRALLVELPYSGWPMNSSEAVFRWRLHGFRPVLAHPERNDRIQRNPRLLEDLVRIGAIAQGTVPSLVGTFGPRPRASFLRLLADGWLSLLASDSHYGRGRPAGMAEGLRALKGWAPGADVPTLTRENPARLLRGEPLRDPGPVRVRRAWEKYLYGNKMKDGTSLRQTDETED
ncbi:MAG: tyrosine-protein phosphatase [Thermoleophilia bacterium]